MRVSQKILQPKETKDFTCGPVERFHLWDPYGSQLQSQEGPPLTMPTWTFKP